METTEEKEVRKEKLESQEKHAEVVRVLWRHENDLMTARFTWFTTLQGLLFTALAFAWKSKYGPLLWSLCFLGVTVSISIIIVFNFGQRAFNELELWWQEQLVEQGYKGPPLTARYKSQKPEAKSKPKAKLKRVMKFVPWRVVPKAFLAVWLFISGCLLYIELSGIQFPTSPD